MDKKSRDLVMGKLYLKNKDYKMAEKSLTEYINMNPSDVAALKLLAQVYESLKEFDKAFEMYQRCYLAEPERVGVLLDICRILLMAEIWLDGVDYRKWLNLAIKAHPSNPIVVNFKAFLSTLPPDEQFASVREASPKQSFVSNSKSIDNGSLVKVFEKLTSIDKKSETIEDRLEKLAFIVKRLETIEEKLDKLSLLDKRSASIENKLEKLTSIDKRLETIENKMGNLKAASSSDVITKNIVQEVKDVVVERQDQVGKRQEVVALKENAVEEKKNISEEKKDTSKEISFNQPFTSNLFAESIKKFNIPDTFSFKPIQPATEEKSPNNEPLIKPISQAGFGASLSTNLFADSIKKFNVPETFSFKPAQLTTPPSLLSQSTLFAQPTQSTQPEGEDELVPNEELPIENTCDMKPIDIKTGEEDENIIFSNRCKLFRFRDKEFKERGLGDIKIMSHKTTGKGRLVMRREVIGLVCLNCWDCKTIRMRSDTQVQFSAMDASDGVAEATLFLVKFKLKDTAETFKKHLDSLFSEKQEGEVEIVDPEIVDELVDKARQLKLPDLFYHNLKTQQPSHEGCNGCDN